MIRESEDGCGGEGVDERAKGGFLVLRPNKGDVFLGKGEEKASDF